MTRTEPLDAVVLGGGLSGLVVLLRLAEAGLSAVALERSARAGGVVRTIRRDGFLFEAGPNTVQATAAFARLAADVGLGDRLLFAERGLPRLVFHGGRLSPAPLGPLAFLRSGLLSRRAKLRVLREPWVPARRAGGEETVEAFFARRFGHEVVEALVAPLVSGTFAGEASALSAEAVFPGAVALEREAGSVVGGFVRGLFASRGEGSGPPRLASFPDGLEELPRALAARLGDRLRLRAEAIRVARGPAGGWRVETAGGEAVDGRALVIATEARAAAALLREAAPEASSALGEIGAASVVTATLAYPVSALAHDARAFGFLAAPAAGLRILGCIFASSLFPGRSPDGWHALTAFVGGARRPTDAELADEAVVRLVADDLERALGARGAPRVLAVERWPRALPQYALGHRERAERALRAAGERTGLHVTGNYLAGISVGEMIARAEATATAVIASNRATR